MTAKTNLNKNVETEVKKEFSKNKYSNNEPITFMSSDLKDSDSDEENISLNLL